MKRKQLNIRIPQSHINRINEIRGDLTQSELIMRLIDEEWGRKKKMSDKQVITGSNLKIEDGRLFAYGDGAEGVKWYNCASATETCQEWDGQESQHTVQEAFDKGILEVHVGFGYVGIVADEDGLALA